MGKILRNIFVLSGPFLYIGGFFFLAMSSEFNFIPLLIIIIGAISKLFAKIYCICHVANNKEELKELWIVHLLLIIFLGVLYVPVYFVHFVLKKSLALGIVLTVIYPILCVIVFITVIVLNVSTSSEYKDYITYDGKISVTLPNRFTCETHSSDEYQLKCNANEENEFFGIYNYENELDKSYLINSFYENLLEYYSDSKWKVENINKRDTYASFDIVNGLDKYQVVVDLKDTAEDDSSIIIYIADKSNIGEYNKIYSSIKYAYSNNLL